MAKTIVRKLFVWKRVKRQVTVVKQRKLHRFVNVFYFAKKPRSYIQVRIIIANVLSLLMLLLILSLLYVKTYFIWRYDENKMWTADFVTDVELATRRNSEKPTRLNFIQRMEISGPIPCWTECSLLILDKATCNKDCFTLLNHRQRQFWAS